MPELLPTRSLYALGAPVRVEVRGLTDVSELRLLQLGEVIWTERVSLDGVVDLGPRPPGGYGVALVGADGESARTAVQVLRAEDHGTVLRYGFVASYPPGRELDPFSDNVRRLHLTAVQFYDWAYRHADLLGGGDAYADALGNPVELATVRGLVRACHDVGAHALGYAATYAVGHDDWARWSHLGLRTASGAAYGLGDFLRLVDPAADEWVSHLGDGLADAVASVGFDGFHLDQYGQPKRALDADGHLVDLAASFVSLIGRLRERLPTSRLIFNNVNDFPTWATARASQDAVYVEVWEPNVEYADLARIVARARAAGGGKPVAIAAYQHVYDTAPVEQADQATAFTMATVFSHGATHLLAGEADRVLVDPYYVRNHVIGPSTAAFLKRWYDFLVEHHDLLLPADVVEVTGSYAGDYNGDLEVSYDRVRVTQHPRAGQVWRRVTRVGDRLVLHLVNLVGQDDVCWDRPHQAPVNPGVGTLRIRLVAATPSVRIADPDGSGHLEPVSVRPVAAGPSASDAGGEFVVAELPPVRTWQLVLIDGC